MVKYSRKFQRIAIPIVSLAFHIFYRIKITGRENIPNGGCVVCANHCQLSDPPLLAVALTGRNDIAVMAKKELFSVFFLGPLIASLGAFPVDRKKADITAIKTALNAVKNDRKLIIFPEGTTHHGEDSEAKEGAAMLALRTHAPVLPVYISENKKFFSKVHIIIGESFTPKVEKDEKDVYKRVSNDILRNIYSLSGKKYAD